MNLKTLATTMIVALSIGVSANAAIIWDYSPDTTGATYGGDWVNQSHWQNFAEKVNFSSNTTVGGMDIYSGSLYGNVGDIARVRFWSDNGGVPGTLLSEFDEAISVIDTDGTATVTDWRRKHVDFSTGNLLNLLANTTYWIGMSGVGYELAQGSLNTPDDGQMAQFDGASYAYPAPVGDMAFRLHGEGGGAPVPEPGTWLLLGSGLAGLAVFRKRFAQK